MSHVAEPAASQSGTCLALERYFGVELARCAQTRDEVYRLRYQVYCVEHPFENASEHPDGRERDVYDARSVHALVRHRASGECAAGVRLVLAHPEHGLPALEHCASAMSRQALEHLAELPLAQVAEISRFAVSRSFRRRAGEQATPSGMSDRALHGFEQRQALPHITLALFAGIVRLSAEQGVTHWVAVMEPSLLRLLRRFGIELAVCGKPIEYHGTRLPTLSRTADIMEAVSASHPEIWHFATEGGRFIPGVRSDVRALRPAMRAG